MKRFVMSLACMLLLAGMLSGCIVWPYYDDGYYGGGYGGHHHHHHYYRD